MIFGAKWRKLGQTAGVLALLAIGFTVGVMSRDAELHADVRSGKPATSFQSGAQRSELKLIEISATLQKMDARLERLEKLALQIVQQDSSPLPSRQERRR